MERKLLCVCMTLMMFCMSINVEAEIANGKCGENLTWIFSSEDSTLTISGSGDMDDWSSVVDIPWYLYRPKIKDVIIGNSVTSIGVRAFFDCTHLTSATIGNSVMNVGDYAFYSCISMTSVTLGNSVKRIGKSVFRSSNLKYVICKATNPPTISSTSFAYTPKITTLKVYESSLDAYKQADYWKMFSKMETMPDINVFVVEGKKWDITGPMYGSFSQNYWVGKQYLQGDTVINDLSCKKLYEYNRLDKGETQYIGALVEKDKKVFVIFPGRKESTLLYDFSISVGGKVVFGSETYTLASIETHVTDAGVLQNYWVFQNMDSGYCGFWIEGVGSTGGPLSPFMLPGNYLSVLSCDEDGKNIYSWSDNQAYENQLAKKYELTNVNVVKCPKLVGMIFNLQGQKLDAPQKGINILRTEDGKTKKVYVR